MLTRSGFASAVRAGLAFCLFCIVADSASAAYRLCAMRDGPRGPCTCKTEADGPGQFSEAPKSRCRPAVSEAKKKEKEEAAEAAKQDAATAAAEAEPSETPSTSEAAASEEIPSEAPDAEPAVADTATQEPAADTPAAIATEGAAPAAAEAEAAPVETGATTTALPTASTGARLDAIRQRGKLLCGVNTGLLGFSAQTGSGAWAGLDVDFCHALAAAVFGDASKVEFVAVETNERFDALKDGRIDVLARNTTWTMNREVELGIRFAGILYFDGQGFMTSDERGYVSAQQLSGSKVCVETGTTTEKNMAFYFKAHQIDAETKAFPTRDETINAYLDGTCDTISGDRSSLFSDRASFPEPQKHAILPEVISKEPLGPAVYKGDEEWSEIVRWTLAGLINAEEVGLDKAAAASTNALSDDAERLVTGAGASGEKLRLNKTWLRDVVAAVGHYGELFEANVGGQSPLGMERGLNALWKRGGILSAPPMW